MPNQSVHEVAEITASPEDLGIPVEYVQPVAEPGQEAPRIMLFAEYSVVQEIEPEVEPVPEPEVCAPVVVEPESVYIPDPEPVIEVQPEPAPVLESHLTLTKPVGAPIPFQFKPLSDPRVVPGASRVVVFQRGGEAPKPPTEPIKAPAPEPQPIQTPEPEPSLSALEEFFRQPPSAPVPASDPAPAPVATPPLPRVQRPYLKEVRVIQGNSTVVRAR